MCVNKRVCYEGFIIVRTYFDRKNPPGVVHDGGTMMKQSR